jgi:hypothetical protein
LKRTFLLSILAGVSAALLPLAATCQVSTTSRTHSTDEADKTYKYVVYGGFAYSALNQVNQSRYALGGINVSVTRNFGKYFGATAEGDYFKFALGSANPGNPGNPSVESVLFGPEIHANVYGKFNGFVHVLLGGEHTAGESETPNISFAGGPGGGLEYNLSPRLALRASGDYIGASFSLANNSGELANSPHRTWNPRASIGAVYRF